jgi:serine/threonine-protein kinase
MMVARARIEIVRRTLGSECFVIRFFYHNLDRPIGAIIVRGLVLGWASLDISPGRGGSYILLLSEGEVQRLGEVRKQKMKLEGGTRLGAFEILEPLGSGGMGEVYLARDTRLMRDVAIKVLPDRLEDEPTAVARFEREAQIVASLSHPNIMAIHDVGRGEGMSYAVMELLEGETLRETLERVKLSPRKAVEIALQIAAGLAAAHERGIIHRDLKPANLFITRHGLVKILDFGLAKQDPKITISEGGSESLTVDQTGVGVVLGTIKYMSPEQVRGQQVDERADIFSFGVVLYEMLAGARPFRGTSSADIMGAILSEEPEELSSSDREISPALQRVVRRCLEKNVHGRFQTARDLAFALETVSDFSASHDSTADSAVVSGQTGVHSSVAVLPFANMSPDPEQEFFCEGMAEEIINALGTIEGLRVAARSSAFRFTGKKQDIREVGEALKVKTVLEGAVRTAGNRVRVTVQLVDVDNGFQLWSERYDRGMEDVFALQDEISENIVEALQMKLGTGAKEELKRPTASLEAYQLYLKGQHNWYRRETGSLQKAAVFFEQAADKDPSYALAHAGIANAYSSLGFYGLEPKLAREKTDAAVERALALDPELAEVRAAVGLKATFLDWDWETAERELTGAFATNPSYVLAYCWYSFVLSWTGVGEKSIEIASHAREIDPLSPYTNTALGLALLMAGRAEDALQPLGEAVDIDSDYLYTSWGLGATYGALGRHGDAVPVLEKAVMLSGRSSFYLGWLGWAYGLAGRRNEAEEMVAELTERRARQYVQPTALKRVHCGLGNIDEAFEWLDNAIVVGDSNAALIQLPTMDPLREDPRFAAVRERLNMPG